MYSIKTGNRPCIWDCSNSKESPDKIIYICCEIWTFFWFLLGYDLLLTLNQHQSVFVSVMIAANFSLLELVKCISIWLTKYARKERQCIHGTVTTMLAAKMQTRLPEIKVIAEKYSWYAWVIAWMWCDLTHFCEVLGADKLRIQRFTAKVGLANYASLRLFEKIGFKEV